MLQHVPACASLCPPKVMGGYLPESGVYRAMSIDGSPDDLREIVHAWLDLPGVL